MCVCAFVRSMERWRDRGDKNCNSRLTGSSGSVFANTRHPRPSFVARHVASIPAGAPVRCRVTEGPSSQSGGKRIKEKLVTTGNGVGLKYARATNYQPNEIKPAAICSYQQEVGGWDLISPWKQAVAEKNALLHILLMPCTAVMPLDVDFADRWACWMPSNVSGDLMQQSLLFFVFLFSSFALIQYNCKDIYSHVCQCLGWQSSSLQTGPAKVVVDTEQKRKRGHRVGELRTDGWGGTQCAQHQ